jgi:predicted ATP-dependent protease
LIAGYSISEEAVTQPDPNQQPAPVDPPASEQKFTQEQVNAILAEEKRKTLAKFEGFDGIKAKAARFEEIEAQNATDLEKATKKAADEARAEMSTTTNKQLVRAEVKAAAAGLGFHNPAIAATQLADKFATVKVSDTGDVDEAAVKALVEQLAKDEPYLVKTDSGRPQPLLGQGHHKTSPSPGQDQAAEQARKRGFVKDPA